MATKTPLCSGMLFQGDPLGQRDQLGVERLAHVGEARSQPVVVLANQRIVTNEIDVIVDDHEVALGPLRVHSAAGIADDQHLAAHGLHDAHGKRDLLEGVAFIEMETTLHRDNVFSGERSEDEFPGMLLDR